MTPEIIQDRELLDLHPPPHANRRPTDRTGHVIRQSGSGTREHLPPHFGEKSHHPPFCPIIAVSKAARYN